MVVNGIKQKPSTHVGAIMLVATPHGVTLMVMARPICSVTISREDIGSVSPKEMVLSIPLQSKVYGAQSQI